MELIPVFSLIVLVATIGTFILAVGAYVMFRYKERKSQDRRPHFPAAYEAEVVAPELIGTPQPLSAAPMTGRREHPGDQKTALYAPENHVPNPRTAFEDHRRWG